MVLALLQKKNQAKIEYLKTKNIIMNTWGNGIKTLEVGKNYLTLKAKTEVLKGERKSNDFSSRSI